MFSREKQGKVVLPAQQVSAKHFHFDVVTPPDDCEDSFPIPLRRDRGSVDLTQRRASESTARSRITSWSNSTIIDDAELPVEQKRLSSIRELPSQSPIIPQSTSGETIKSKPSHWIRNRQKSSSGEGQRLYNALRKQISAVNLDDSLVTINDSIPPPKSSHVPACSHPFFDTRQTIRTDHPHEPGGHVDAKRSRVPTETCKDNDITNQAEQLIKAHVKSNYVSSETDRKRRHERSRNRLQEMLRQSVSSLDDDNNGDPYRFGDIPSKMSSPCSQQAVQHRNDHVDLFNPTSPSIYSTRDVEEEMSFKSKPSNISTVTIVSRDVKNYDISPTRKIDETLCISRPSNEWRSWMSGQMTDLEEQTIIENSLSLSPLLDVSIEQHDHLIADAGNRHISDNISRSSQASIQTSNSNSRISHIHDAVSSLRLSKTRTRLNKKPSGDMLVKSDSIDEKPKTLTKKMSSLSLAAVRRISSAARASVASVNMSRVASRCEDGAVRDRISPEDEADENAMPVAIDQTLVSLGQYHGQESFNEIMASPLVETFVPKPTVHSFSGVKSVIDLRARYRSNYDHSRDASIQIHRKLGSSEQANDFNDGTLKGIRKGPYAQSLNPNAKQDGRADYEDFSASTVTLKSDRLSGVNKENEGPARVCTPNMQNALHVPVLVSRPSKQSLGTKSTIRMVRPVASTSALSEKSSTRTLRQVNDLGKNTSHSPGQKMVDDFLNRKYHGLDVVERNESESPERILMYDKSNDIGVDYLKKKKSQVLHGSSPRFV